MPEEHCFVCASNEGIFLDVFADGRNYRNIIETCLSLKVQKKKMPSTKICHKCVYELDQCSKFVQKYKKTHQIEKGKLCKKRGCCCLCMEPGKKGYIFDLWNENRLDSSVEKLNELFEVDSVTENLGSLSICLDCRYNLDVLVDMKNLFKDTSRFLEDISNSDMDLSEFPKITTSVVKRQTTLTRTSKLSLSKSSLMDNDTGTIGLESPKRVRALSSRKSRKSSPHERKCDECNATIDNGMDMYRYHHTGNTVCKECWLTMDPCGKTKSRARKMNNATMKTKLCSVFLKDILTDAFETEKNTTSCKIEKGADGETIYVISSDETDNENETQMLSTRLMRTKRKESVVETKPKKKLKTQDTRRASLTRSNSVQSINQVNRRSTRLTRSESAETSDSEGKKLRKRSETIGKSEPSTSKPKREKKSKESQSRANQSQKRKTNKSGSSSSSNEVILPSKVRRFSSPSYKINSNDSKDESDSDDEPYVCKICFNNFENKIVGKTHELTHSKKLGVMLQKVEVPEQSEEDETLEQKTSTKFNPHAESDGGSTEIVSDVNSAETEESGQLAKLHEDLPKDDDNVDEDDDNDGDTDKGGPKASAPEHDENKGDEDKQKKRHKVGPKNVRKDTVKNKKREVEKKKKQSPAKNKKKGTAKERDNENIIAEEADKENGVEEKEDMENNIEKDQTKKGELEQEISTNESIQDNKSVRETNNKGMKDIDEPPAKTHEPNRLEDISEKNDTVSLETNETAQDKISTEEQNAEVIKDGIKNVAKNTTNSSEKTENLLTNDEKVDESKGDSVSSSVVVEKNYGESMKESNDPSKEEKMIENGDLANENKKVDESKEADEKQEDREGKTDMVSEEKNEETISNGNVRKLSNVEEVISGNDDGVKKSEGTECSKHSEKSEECSDLNDNNDGKKNDDIANDETNNEAGPDEIESRVEFTENEINHNNDNVNESIEVENRLAELMGESEAKQSQKRIEKTSDDVENIESMPLSESTLIENNSEL